MKMTGIIDEVLLEEKLLSIRKGRRRLFFYLQSNLIKKFKLYLNPGTVISFVYDEACTSIKDGLKVYTIAFFTKIKDPKKNGFTKYYDLGVIQNGIKELLNKKTNKMFLDLEMTMPSYRVDIYGFRAEIFQVGYYIVDENDKIIREFQSYVKPTLIDHITTRTVRFLHIDKEVVQKEWISYQEFYQVFKTDIEKYAPTIFVWGKNDIIVINDSYTINKVESLCEKTIFVNLLQLYKNYYNLSSDIGLFKLYSLLNNKESADQIHDALEDARYTHGVFNKFKEKINI